MIEAIPPQILSIVGLGVFGYIGNTFISEIGGGKTLSTFLNLIVFGAGATIGLVYLWEQVHRIASVFGISF